MSSYNSRKLTTQFVKHSTQMFQFSFKNSVSHDSSFFLTNPKRYSRDRKLSLLMEKNPIRQLQIG